jgi:glutathione S-transferase
MQRQLITFGISHYCEKARWALDWHGIPFDEVGWPPGLHLRLARRLGAPGNSLPILLADGVLVQGSDEIIDWTERKSSDGDRSLAPTGDLEDGRSIEQRADRVVGVHVRRLFYSEVLPHQAHLAKPWLLLNTSPIHRFVGNLMWPAVRKRMIQFMDTPPEAAPESRAKLEAELDWLDETLSDGRRFLAGERFSRVDLTVAALLAPFARPEQARVYNAITLPPALEEDVARWRHRPSMAWVRAIYAQYRRPVPVTLR